MTTWVDRIRSRMKELGITQEELADKLGITRGAVTHYLAGRRVPPLSKFNEIARVLKADAAWLQFGIETRVQNPSETEKVAANLAIIHRQIPILSWEQVVKDSFLRNLNPTAYNEIIPHLFTDQPNWYALRVKGDSMVTISGSKSFHENDIIIIDPDKEPKYGDFVIAILPKAKEATLKQFVVDGGIEYLKPLNTQYPILSYHSNIKIIGIVVRLLNYFN